MSVQEQVQVDQQQVDASTDTGTVQDPQQVEQGAEVEAEGQTEQQADEGQQQQTERDEKGRFKGVQPRIDELTRARREAEREAAYWRQVATQGQAQPSAQAAPQKPTPDQFDDYGAYVEALTDWKAEQAVAKRMELDSTRKVAETRAQTFAERQAQARTTMPDYDEVVGGSNTPIADHVGEAMLESELGPQLAYHFAKNPDVLMRLNGMSPVAAAREMGRLEATLGTKAAAPAAPSKKLSATPPPAGTLGSQGRATKPSLATASMEEYMAQRKAQGARWAR